MRNRRGFNQSTAESIGKSLPVTVKPDNFVPSKSDLFKILDSLQHKESPGVKDSRRALIRAERALKAFERSNKTWKRLHEVEKLARRRVFRALNGAEQSQWQNEKVKCRNAVRLYGVTKEIIGRIQRLMNGDGEE
jgi:hypothetical protein